MSGSPNEEAVVSYYDTVVKNKLHNYLYGNPRVDAAWQTIVKYQPQAGKMLEILEVGCGVGTICHRMAQKWPQASISGLDISPRSIEVAHKLFGSEQVQFTAGVLTADQFNRQFDLIIFMDVYEHIAVDDRPTVHHAIKKLLRNRGRVILSVPTPHNLQWSAKHKPETMQPVDEHISLGVIEQLARETDTEVIFYEKKDIWNTGDYAHIVLEKNDDFQAAFFKPKPVSLKQSLKRRAHKWSQRLTAPFKQVRLKRRLK